MNDGRTGASPAWVAAAALAEAIGQALSRPGAPSQNELARKAGVSARMLRKILKREVQWVRIETADELLVAAGHPELLCELEVVVPA